MLKSRVVEFNIKQKPGQLGALEVQGRASPPIEKKVASSKRSGGTKKQQKRSGS